MDRIAALCAHLEPSPASAGSGRPSQPPQHPEGVTVAVLSHAGAAHVTAYLDGLAVVSEVCTSRRLLGQHCPPRSLSQTASMSGGSRCARGP